MSKIIKQPPRYALSIKQPWATLVVHGLKTIEIRSWPTSRRGVVWIHAGQISDSREEAWRHLPDDLQHAAKQKGGIIGRVELTDCLKYSEQKSFDADCGKHLNDPSWFHEPPLYGFVLGQPQPTEFEPLKGWVRFFRIE